MDLNELDRELLTAHANQNTPELVRLYTLAADQAELKHDNNAAGFYLTQAFVFALEIGAPEAAVLNQRLADSGRAERLNFEDAPTR